MKKHLLLTLAACGIFVHANAQQAILENVSGVFQPVIKARDGGALIYTSYQLNDGKYVVQRYTGQLMPMPAIEFTLPEAVKVNDIELTGPGVLVIGYDQKNKSRLLYLVDEVGQIVKEMSEVDPVENAYFYAINPFEVLQLTPTTYGYEVKKINAELKTLWRQSYQPSNADWSVERVLSSSTYLYVLRSEQKDDKKEYVMQCIDALSGKEVYAYNISEMRKGVTPTVIKITPGGVVVAGILVNGVGKDEGIFYVSLDHGGKVQYAGRSEADVIRSQLAKNMQSTEALKLVVEGIADMHADNSIVLMAQTYKVNRAEGGADKKGKRKKDVAGNTQLQLSNVIFFNFNKSGELLSAANLDAGKQDISLKNNEQDDNAVINWLANNRLLSYEGSIETGRSPQVLFKTVNNGNLQYYAVPFGDTVKENRITIGSEVKMTTSEIDIPTYVPASGTLINTEGVLIYSYMNQQVKIGVIPYTGIRR